MCRLCAESRGTLHCGAQASHCGGFSCCGAQAPGLVGPAAGTHRPRDSQALECGLVVVAHGLSCSTACGIFLDQELKLCPLHWQADSYPLCHQESPCFLIFKNLSFYGSFRLTAKISEDTEISHMSLFPHMHPYQYPRHSGTLATNDD